MMNLVFFGWVGAVFIDDILALLEEVVADEDVAWLDDGDGSCEFLVPVKRNIHDEYECLKQNNLMVIFPSKSCRQILGQHIHTF